MDRAAIASHVVKLEHQGQQVAQVAAWKTFAGKPGKIGAGQVGNQPALIFAERNRDGYQPLQVFGFHGMDCKAIMMRREGG
jgi:hypothetical protein